MATTMRGMAGAAALARIAADRAISVGMVCAALAAGAAVGTLMLQGAGLPAIH